MILTTHSALCDPSQSGFLALCLQPQDQTFFVLFRLVGDGREFARPCASRRRTAVWPICRRRTNNRSCRPRPRRQKALFERSRVRTCQFLQSPVFSHACAAPGKPFIGKPFIWKRDWPTRAEQFPADPRRSGPARTDWRPRHAASTAPAAASKPFMPWASRPPISPASTSPEPAVAKVGGALRAMAARPSGLATTVSGPFSTTMAPVSTRRRPRAIRFAFEIGRSDGTRSRRRVFRALKIRFYIYIIEKS